MVAECAACEREREKNEIKLKMNIIYIEKIILIKYRKDLDSGMYQVFEK
jgi:hypothetical protein